MKGFTEYDVCYDRVFQRLWFATMTRASNWKECYRAAKIYGRFLLRELDRKAELIAKKEKAIARRGLVSSDTIFNTWLWNVIDECSYYRAPLPPEIRDVLSNVLGRVSPERVGDTRLNKARKKFLEMRLDSIEQNKPDFPVNETAHALGVNPSTISRWIKADDPDSRNRFEACYSQVLEKTQLEHFRAEGRKRVVRSRWRNANSQ